MNKDVDIELLKEVVKSRKIHELLEVIKMVSLEEAKKIVLEKHPEEWIYQVTEFQECYQFWLLPKHEKWYPTTFIWDTPIVDKQTGKLNDEGTVLDTDLNHGLLHWYDYRHSND